MIADKTKVVTIRFTHEQRVELGEILGTEPEGIEFTVGELEEHVTPIKLDQQDHLEGLWIFLGLSDE